MAAKIIADLNLSSTVDTLSLNNILENITLDVAAYQALGIHLFVLFNLDFLQINKYLHTETDVGRQIHVSVFDGITEVQSGVTGDLTVFGAKVTMQFDFSRNELTSEDPLTARRGRQRISLLESPNV